MTSVLFSKVNKNTPISWWLRVTCLRFLRQYGAEREDAERARGVAADGRDRRPRRLLYVLGFLVVKVHKAFLWNKTKKKKIQLKTIS